MLALFVLLLMHGIYICKFSEFGRFNTVEKILVVLEVAEGYSSLDELLYGIHALLKVCQATLASSIFSVRHL